MHIPRLGIDSEIWGNCMNSELWQWCLRAFEKFALLGVPAILILLFWKRRGVVASMTLYRASWVNPIGYLLWLAAVIVVSNLSHFPAFSWLAFSILPACLYFFCPFLLSVASLILCLLGVRSKREEQAFVAVPNLLMLLLWISSVVAPN